MKRKLLMLIEESLDPNVYGKAQGVLTITMLIVLVFGWLLYLGVI